MRVRKAVAISIAAVCGVTILVLLTMPVWANWLLQRSMEKTYEQIATIRLPCGEMTQVIERWSKAGYTVSCQRGGLKHGPWQAWENGHLAISGEYLNGKEHGAWLVYSTDGASVYRTLKFDNGREVENFVH